MAHAGSEEITKPRFESRPGIEYKLLQGRIQTRRLSAAAISSGLKAPEVLFPSGVGTSHRSVSSLLVSLVDSRFTALWVPLFMSYEAMEFAETAHRREKCPDLTVSLLMVLHALRLECEKSMKLTAGEVDGIDQKRYWLMTQ